MQPRVPHALPDPPLQLITGAWRDASDLEGRVAAALRGGVRWVQLRAKDRPAREIHEAACVLVSLLQGEGGLLVVNDRVDIAIAAGAGGVHLPENGMRAGDARALLGPDAWIARSTHAAKGVREMEDLDAFQLGPVFETESKRAYGPPLGLEQLAAAGREATRVVAVGGITPANVHRCVDAGAAAVSIIGAIWNAADVEAAAREAVASLRAKR